MRALIDILNDEKRIIENIENFEKAICSCKRQIEEIDAIEEENGKNPNAPLSWLARNREAIDNKRAAAYCDLHAEQTKLHNIRNEIKMYFHDLKYGEEDVMSDGD